MQNPDNNNNSPFVKGPKRKRLAKACDACHKSKRRCDGTAPCSNCYYASKQCTYTDASGRPVPAPRPFKPERQDPQPSSSSSETRTYPSQDPSRHPNHLRIYPNTAGPSHQYDTTDDDHKHTRKRFRNDRGNPMPVEDLIIDGPISGVSIDRPTAVELDPALTRELTNLFFTHCHPARAIIHKPTFASELGLNRVPSHLLLAVCALAAPLSKQPRIRTTPSRFAGKPFAQEALSQMFDGAGRLVCEPDLAAAQALCILQMHDILIKEKNIIWSSRYHELALQIVEVLGVHSPEHPTLTPVPSQEFVQASTEREAIRRIFWFIHLLDVVASIYFKKPVTFTDSELRLRLPVDETSFELGVHSTLPEYLYLPAVRTQYASEFGHLIRIISIYARMESILDEMNDPESVTNPIGALLESEQKMEEWARTLPDHLRFSQQSLQVQQSMFETSSNTGAWCWCCMHVYHASCTLALHTARQRNQRGSRSDPPWALETLDLILKMLGDRAKNSILMGIALWPLVKYCKRDDAQVRQWASINEENWGTAIFELVLDWRSSPPLQHQQPHQIPHSHGLTHTNHSQHQHSHRRPSDTRNPNSQITLANSGTGSRVQIHQHGSETSSYSNNNPGNSSGSSSGSSIVRRSPSDSSPTSYPLGRPPNTTAGNAGSISNRNLGLGSHHTGGLPDLASAGTASGSRDSRPGAAVGIGHSGNGNDGSSLSQNQGLLGKYPVGNSSRWSLDSSSGSDSAIQNGFSNNSGVSGPGVPVDMNSLSLGQIGGGSGSGSGNNGGGGGGAGSGILGLSGNGSSNSNNSSVQRSLVLLSDGPQSLPSLKASGLLDSWGSVRVGGAVDTQKQASNALQQQQQQLASPRRTTPPSMIMPSLPHHQNLHHLPHSDSADLRTTATLGMPVGLQWLANESR